MEPIPERDLFKLEPPSPPISPMSPSLTLSFVPSPPSCPPSPTLTDRIKNVEALQLQTSQQLTEVSQMLTFVSTNLSKRLDIEIARIHERIDKLSKSKKALRSKQNPRDGLETFAKSLKLPTVYSKVVKKFDSPVQSPSLPSLPAPPVRRALRRKRSSIPRSKSIPRRVSKV
jgi:hypothetical protein